MHQSAPRSRAVRVATLLGFAAVLALGLVLSGWLVGRGFAEGRRSERFVTVKGWPSGRFAPTSPCGRCVTWRPATT